MAALNSIHRIPQKGAVARMLRDDGAKCESALNHDVIKAATTSGTECNLHQSYKLCPVQRAT